MSDATDAIIDIKDALEEYGSTITLVKQGAEIRDDYDNIITPATDIQTVMKALVGTSATDTTLGKLTQAQKESYQLSLRLYTTEIINQDEYFIKFRNEDYNIVFISEIILQDTTLMYELLVKK